MKPSEAARLPYEAHSRPVEIEGFLIASGVYSHLVDSEDILRSREPHFGILINHEAIRCLETLELDNYAGSWVGYTGHVRLKGTMTHTGFSMLPKYIYFLYYLTYWNDRIGTHEFHFSDTFKDVHLISPKSVRADLLRDIAPYFERTDTYMSIKSYLEENDRFLLQAHVQGEELEKTEALLRRHDLHYELIECEVGLGGMP